MTTIMESLMSAEQMTDVLHLNFVLRYQIAIGKTDEEVKDLRETINLLDSLNVETDAMQFAMDHWGLSLKEGKLANLRADIHVSIRENKPMEARKGLEALRKLRRQLQAVVRDRSVSKK